MVVANSKQGVRDLMIAKAFSIATKKFSLIAAAAAILVITGAPLQVLAAPLTQAPAAKISFTFDDGFASTYNNALPTLSKYGLAGTDYISTGCIGMTTTPNTCQADNDMPYMTWDQVKLLQSAGWEIGSHTVHHTYLATSDAGDGQPDVLTEQQVDYELTQSKADLAAHGINAVNFATPYGDYNRPILAKIAKLYASQRGFADQNNNDWPYNDYIINDYHVEGRTSVTQVKAKIDDAIANKRWLVLTFHNIFPKASKQAYDYQWSTDQLDQVAAYVSTKVKASTLNNVTINQGLITGTNMLPNGSFNSGISGGWTTDNPTSITVDTGNNGNYPDPTNSIKLTSAATEKHLYSPKVNVDANTTYAVKSFLNVQSITSGSVGFYIDEYDVNGNWISGQYKRSEPTAFVENLNFGYKPTSVNVRSASLQVIVGGTGILAYLDNVQMFPVETSTTPPVTQTNLVANGTFDAGISSGWTTDKPTSITADSNNNGSPSNPVNSVKGVSNSSNSHLFSPKVTVDSTKNYSLTTYVNLKAMTSGEVGFYVDEYDVNGNWISGQYKFGVRAVSTGDIALNYKPTSTNVKTASLQIIVTGNSGITAYIDDVRWYLLP